MIDTPFFQRIACAAFLLACVGIMLLGYYASKSTDIEMLKFQIFNNIPLEKSDISTPLILNGNIIKQFDFCPSLIYNLTTSSNYKLVTIKGNRWINSIKQEDPFQMFLYKSGDIVSNEISAYGEWESSLGRDFTKVLEILKKNWNLESEELGVLDIGANIGWFTLNFANHRYKTFSFEPLLENQHLSLASLCLNPKLQIFVTYHPFGLGTSTQTCKMISGKTEEGSFDGDAFTICNNDANYAAPQGYMLRGAMFVKSLNEVMKNTQTEVKRIGLLKIDIEGYEYYAISGGLEWINEARIPYIMSEFSPVMMGGKENAKKYLQLWLDLGYHVYLNSWFNQRRLNNNQIEKLYTEVNINIFLKNDDFM